MMRLLRRFAALFRRSPPPTTFSRAVAFHVINTTSTARWGRRR